MHTDALMVPVGQEYGSSLAGGFGLRVSHEVVGKMSAAAESLKDSTNAAGSTSRRAHSPSCCWKPPHHGVPPQGCLSSCGGSGLSPERMIPQGTPKMEAVVTFIT